MKKIKNKTNPFQNQQIQTIKQEKEFKKWGKKEIREREREANKRASRKEEKKVPLRKKNNY